MLEQSVPSIKPPLKTDFLTAVKLSHGLIACMLALLTIALLMATSRDMGLIWDEPIYMEASVSYMNWFDELLKNPQNALQSQTIDQYWMINHEHPPFDKVWSGFFWSLTRHFLDDITAHRVGNIVLAGILTALVYLLVAPQYGIFSGLGAVGALLTMPRLFFHAHLAALDVPTSATIFLTFFVFWRVVDRPGLKWSLAVGVVYGIACMTKINGLVEVPVVLIFWSVIFRRRKYVFVRLLLMGINGLLVSVLLWPWLYHDIFGRVVEYVKFMTVNHYQISQWYEGKMFLPPPWHYPFVMTLTTLPLIVTLLAATGVFLVILSGHDRALGWLFIFSALFPLLIVAAKLTQAFDDERLLIPAFPFIAVLAGIAYGYVIQRVQEMAGRLKRSRWTVPLTVLVTGLAFTPQLANAAVIYPHLLSYYSLDVGELRGAANLGFETTYWAETYAAALPYLNNHTKPNDLVWVEAHDVMLYYQKVGLLRNDVRIASSKGNEGIVSGEKGYTDSINHADYAVIEFRQSGFTKEITDWMSARTPVFELSYYGVPVMRIYQR